MDDFRFVIIHLEDRTAFFVGDFYEYSKQYERVTNSSWKRLINLSKNENGKHFEVTWDRLNATINVYSYKSFERVGND